MITATKCMPYVMVSLIGIGIVFSNPIGYAAEGQQALPQEQFEDRAKWDCEFVVLLLVGLASDGLSPYTRARATSGLGYLGGFADTPNWVLEIAIPALRERLGDDDERVRTAAARAVGNYGSAAAPVVPDLIDLLVRDAGKPELLSAAADSAEALGAIGPSAKDAIPVLTRIIAERQVDGPNMLTEKATWALEQIRGEK